MGLRNNLWKIIFVFVGGFIDRTGNGGESGAGDLRVAGVIFPQKNPRIPRLNWLSVLEDPDPVRRAGNFHVFVSNLTPENAQNAAESLLEMRQRNVLSDDNPFSPALRTAL